MKPCDLGFPCPHLVYGEEGDVCIHPYVLSDFPKDGDFSYTEDILCPIDFSRTEFGILMDMASEYGPESWSEVIHRLSVHLDRSYEDSYIHQRIRRELAEAAWKDYLELRGRDSQ